MSEQIRGYILDEPNVPKTPQTANIPPWMGSLPLGEIQQSDDMSKSLRIFQAVEPKAPTMDDSGLCCFNEPFFLSKFKNSQFLNIQKHFQENFDP
jgi:hypothetical protein